MTNRDAEATGTLLPYGPEASEQAVEHVEKGHPTDPPALEYVAKCPLCYAEGLE